MNKFYNFINSTDKEEAELFIDGEIVESEEEKEFIKEWFQERATASYAFADELKALNGKPLKIHCNSYGGSLFAGTAMYCALSEYKGKKTGYIGAVCASAATFPMLACDKTYMSAASAYCPHLPMMIAQGNRIDLERAIDELKAVEEVMIDAYQHKTGLRRDKIRSILEADKFMSSNEAIEYGFVDGLIEDEPSFDEAFVENILACHTAIYNSVYKKISHAAPNEEPPREKRPTDDEIQALQARYGYAQARAKSR